MNSRRKYSDILNIEHDILPRFGSAFAALEDNIEQINKLFAHSGRVHEALCHARANGDQIAEKAQQAAFNKVLIGLCDVSIEASNLVKILAELKRDMLAASEE
jgi:hypothetical protein